MLPPWGGELAIELIEYIDWDVIADSETWFVGWPDISTLLMPLTILTGVATLHGVNLMDEPWELPTEFQRWTQVAGLTEGDSFTQRSALWSLRLAGWFQYASGVLIGRSSAAETSGLNQARPWTAHSETSAYR